MIYKLRKPKDEEEEKRKLFLEDNPGLGLIEEFAKLTHRQFLFVCLSTDNSRDCPVRTLPIKERRDKSARIAGWGQDSDGRYLDKNGRDVSNGKVKIVEEAIAKFRELHWNESIENREALKRQIFEIREFLKSDKRVLMVTSKGQVIKDSEGNDMYEMDHKALESAVKLGVKLPELEEALKKLEDPAEDTKFEGVTGTAADISEDVADDNELSTIDKVMMSRQRNNE